MAGLRKITKDKGIQLVTEMLFVGKVRKDILQTITKTYDVKGDAIDKWIKEAKIIVLERQQQANEIRDREMSAMITEAVKEGLKSNLEIEQRLLQIGWAEIDVEETTSSEQNGTIVFKRKPSPAEQRAALAEVLKMRGAYAAEKHDVKFTPVTGMEIR